MRWTRAPIDALERCGEYKTGVCALREAISSANNDGAVGGCTTGSGFDLINLPAGTYRLTQGVAAA